MASPIDTILASQSPDSPFGRNTRMRILSSYFESVSSLTAANAWEHVYHCLLWMNEGSGLAHIYDSNHMQKGGVFHARAVRFTNIICTKWNIEKKLLPGQIDLLFKGCIAELISQRAALSGAGDEQNEFESDLVQEISATLIAAGVSEIVAKPLAQTIEGQARHYFTIGKKRMNALGEGFEDLIEILLLRLSGVPSDRLHTRAPVSKLPGFSRESTRTKGRRSSREPSPDIAITEDAVTRLIATAKWSLRQDRETQFASEYRSFQNRKIQSTELQYAMITNEFDLARLGNVCRAIPTGEGGYVFHKIYHISLDLLREVHGERFKAIEGYVQTGKLLALEDFLVSVKNDFGI